MKKSLYIAKMGILLALASALQFLEGLIPLPLPLGVKLGLSSIVIMYILMFMGFKSALAGAVLKSCFVLATRGTSAFFMSVSGGILSVVAMWLCLMLFRRRNNDIGILAVSVTGGVFHNVGQLMASSVFAGSIYTVSYLPVLVIAGIIAGAFTGLIMHILLPHLGGEAEHKSSAERSHLKDEEKAKGTKA